MTSDDNSSESGPANEGQSTLAFDPAELMKLRVLPAEFARMCDVSKQTVSQWIKQGKVTIGPDGRLDPTQAAKQVIARTDPGRLRARVFKQAAGDNSDLRKRVAELERENRALREGEGVEHDETSEEGELPANGSYQSARAMRERYQALAAQRDYEVSIRNLVMRSDVAFVLDDIGARVRNYLELLPDRLAPMLAGESDSARCHVMLSEEFRRGLEELSRQLAKAAEVSCRSSDLI